MSRSQRQFHPAAAGRFGVPLLLALAVAAIDACPSAAAWLEFDRTAILRGQLWRLVTGHLTHWTGSHLLWDLTAYVLLALACRQRFPLRWAVCLLVSSIAIALVVLVGLPQMQYYRGLSGLDSALFALLAADLLLSHPRAIMRGLAALVLLAFVAKLGMECRATSALFAGDLGPGVLPVPLAHGVGAITGICCALTPKRLSCVHRLWRKCSFAGAAGFA